MRDDKTSDDNPQGADSSPNTPADQNPDTSGDGPDSPTNGNPPYSDTPDPATDPKPDPEPNPEPEPEPEPEPDVVEAEALFAHHIVASMQSFYFQGSSLWNHGWWNSANSLTALIDYMEFSGSREYLPIVDNVYEKNKTQNFITDDFKDNAWWGLAWLRAFDLTKNEKYLNTAKAIADDMNTNGWDSICNGGVYDRRDKANKNAITNELFIKLTAGLHNRIAADTRYLGYATKGWDWFSKSSLINSQNLVNEALNADCKNSGGTTWTHNQGVILGALAELYRAKNDTSYLDRGKQLATASMKNLSLVSGILKERNDPACDPCSGDERLFKGIYARNLREFAIAAKDKALQTYLKSNAKSAWDKSRDTRDRIGFRWEGPFDSADASRQTAALDLFNATLNRKLPLNLAKGKSVTSPGECKTTETAAGLTDGSVTTKWCFGVPAEGASADIDLGASKTIQRIRILHAGSGGETSSWNTKNFQIFLSKTATGPWQEVVKVENNGSSATIHPISSVSARFVRLFVTQAGADNVIRIYEVAVE